MKEMSILKLKKKQPCHLPSYNLDAFRIIHVSIMVLQYPCSLKPHRLN